MRQTNDRFPPIETLPVCSTICNPFRFFDPANCPNGTGYVRTPEDWPARRAEIRELVQRYFLGYRQPTAPEQVCGGIVADEVENTAVLGGFFGRNTTVYHLDETFASLVQALQAGEVCVDGQRFGPAADAAQAAELAIAAWNAGYAVPYQAFSMTSFGWEEKMQPLRELTGLLDPAHLPGPTRIEHPAVVRIHNPENGATVQFRIQVQAPTAEQKRAVWGDAQACVPFVINIGGSAAFNAANLNPQGYGLVSFRATEIYPDNTDAGHGVDRDGLYTRLFPYSRDRYESDSGAMMAWAWTVSQIITAMERPAIGESVPFGRLLGLDPGKTVVTGHSRFGKAALFAAAFDDRISICCPSEAGGSGVQSQRYKGEGKIFNWNTSYYPKADRVYGRTETATVSYGTGNSWFPEGVAGMVNHDSQLPFDAADIIALVAPRPFFTVSGIDTHWLGNEGVVASVLAAAEVYAFVGRTEEERRNIAVRCRQSDHVFYPQDLCFALAVMDRQFRQGPDDRTLHVRDLFPEGEDYRSMSYPAADYAQLSDMDSYPYAMDSAYLPWSRPDKYQLWTGCDAILTGHDTQIVAHSDAPQVLLTTPAGKTLRPSAAANGQFTFDLAAEDAVYGRCRLHTVGGEKENRTVSFPVVSLADALRHGTTKGDEGDENRVLGFSSRLANTPEDQPQVYVGGQRVSMSCTPARSKPEETTLLAYGIQFHDPLFARIAAEGWNADKTFAVTNLRFVTLPEFTFAFSMADVYASAENGGREGAARFTKGISWPVERYDNGEAAVWPPIPDTLAERRRMEAGETICRPDVPPAHTTAFCAAVTGSAATPDALTIRFSQPLRPGEYGIGLDMPGQWQPVWDETGTVMTVPLDPAAMAGRRALRVILFRLMDRQGALLGGPVELTVPVE